MEDLVVIWNWFLLNSVLVLHNLTAFWHYIYFYFLGGGGGGLIWFDVTSLLIFQFALAFLLLDFIILFLLIALDSSKLSFLKENVAHIISLQMGIFKNFRTVCCYNIEFLHVISIVFLTFTSVDLQIGSILGSSIDWWYNFLRTLSNDRTYNLLIDSLWKSIS